MRRVVVTGVGVISPLGIGAKAHFQRLLAGECAVRRLARYDPSGFPCHIGGEAPEFKVSDHVPKTYRKATKVMARDIELAVVAADDAFKDAGIQSKAYTDTPSVDGRRFGCNIGAGLISVDLAELTAALHVARDGNRLDLQRWGTEGMNSLTPLWLLKYLPNMLACHVTIVHQLMGPSNTITCADASSHLAIGEAFRTIQRGDADLAICGGAETKLPPMSFLRQIKLNRLTTAHNNSPAEAVRPFDADAQGTAIGEGGGLLILEELEHARGRNARIYAEIVGFGASQDSYSVTTPDPTGGSYANAVTSALKDAQVGPADVGLLVPCGLGIPGHDDAELAGLERAFGERLATVPMGLPKGQTGNLAAGSGVDVATTVLALHAGVVPPCINTRKPRNGRRLNVAVQTRQEPAAVAVSSIYSLGGQNAALVFRRMAS